MSMLQSGMEECLRWYVSLAKAIVVHETQEGFGQQQLASSKDPEERQRQKSRRQAVQKARGGLRLGAILVQQRNSKKRFYDEMNGFEQQTLDDYETGRIQKAKQRFTTQRIQPFRCKL